MTELKDSFQVFFLTTAHQINPNNSSKFLINQFLFSFTTTTVFISILNISLVLIHLLVILQGDLPGMEMLIFYLN